MRDPFSVPVLLVLAALVGYAVGTRPVEAQAEQFPFATGQVVTLTLEGSGTHRCLIEEIRGTFARCGDRSAQSSSTQSSSIGPRERPEQWWVNLAQVHWITKPRPNR